MNNFYICRVCLRQGVKMYDHNQHNLKQYYEEIMGKKINENDGLPLHFCYECAAMLHKFQKFKEKCYTGEMELQKINLKGTIKSSSIYLVQSQNKNLQSILNTMVISKRIRTCIVKHKSIARKRGKRNKEGDIPGMEELVISSDSDSDMYLDDKNLAENKNEIINVNSIKDETIDELNTTEEENVNSIENIIIDEKAVPEIEDDRRFSDDDEFNIATVDEKQLVDPVKPVEPVKEDHIDIIDVQKIKNDDKKKVNVKNKTQKKQKGKKEKKFVVRDATKKYDYLDPKHWLKINLTEEEALKEFNAKAQHKRYLTAAYRCTDCLKSFSKEDMLNRHLKLRHSKSLGPVECRFCKMRFKIKSHLTRHLPQHYIKYKCLRCNKMCPLLSTASFHDAYHNGVIQKCKYCGDEFRHQSTYYSHLRSHRSEHLCTLCGASFVSEAGLRMHKRTMHVDTVVDPEEAVNTYCERCNIKFETQTAYEEHLFHSDKHTKGIEDLVGDTPGPSLLKRKKSSIRKRCIPTTCPICNEIFPSVTTFLKHRFTEHKNQKLPSEEQRYICEICGASLAFNSVAPHLNTHTKEKVFNCPTCDMKFVSKSSMKRHQVTHTGEKPYKCMLCDKRFTQKVGANLHYRTFHLQEPYPKRNRRKKKDIQPDLEDFRISGSEDHSG